jgi:hypothetical protein
VLDGDRTFERRIKARHGASSYCPICKPAHNARAAARMRGYREKLKRCTVGE